MLAALFIRALDTRGDVYLPYSFSGDDWTDEEKEIISAAFKPHVPEHVDAMFNNFDVWKTPSMYLAQRATWQGYTLKGKTPEQLAAAIAEYYTK